MRGAGSAWKDAARYPKNRKRHINAHAGVARHRLLLDVVARGVVLRVAHGEGVHVEVGGLEHLANRQLQVHPGLEPGQLLTLLVDLLQKIATTATNVCPV